MRSSVVASFLIHLTEGGRVSKEAISDGHRAREYLGIRTPHSGPHQAPGIKLLYSGLSVTSPRRNNEVARAALHSYVIDLSTRCASRPTTPVEHHPPGKALHLLLVDSGPRELTVSCATVPTRCLYSDTHTLPHISCDSSHPSMLLPPHLLLRRNRAMSFQSYGHRLYEAGCGLVLGSEAPYMDLLPGRDTCTARGGQA